MRKPLSVSPEPLFWPFDAAPAQPDAAFDAVYRVFEHDDVNYPFCTQCFGDVYETRMRAYRGVRMAPYEVFRQIYFEHPNCSGGVETFRHWLPRALELGFLDQEFSLVEQMARIGVLAWPAAEQAALRALVQRAAVEWFGARKTVLGVHFYRAGETPEGFIAAVPGAMSHELIAALLLLRVEPESLFNWMLALDGECGQSAIIWEGLLEALMLDRLLDDDAYLVLPEGADEGAYRAALAGLTTLSRAAALKVLRQQDLMVEWERRLASDPKTAALIAEVDQQLVAMDPLPEGENKRAAIAAVTGHLL